jgi:hypothetical protein
MRNEATVNNIAADCIPDPRRSAVFHASLEYVPLQYYARADVAKLSKVVRLTT